MAARVGSSWRLCAGLEVLGDGDREAAIEAITASGRSLLAEQLAEDELLVLLDGIARATLAASVRGNQALLAFLRAHRERLASAAGSSAVQAVQVMLG